MAMTREEQFNRILTDLHQSTPDIEGAAIISMDGLVMASSLPASVDEEGVSAMAAAIYGIGARTADELNRGLVEQLYIKGENGYFLITQTGPDAMLAIMANSKAKLGIACLLAFSDDLQEHRTAGCAPVTCDPLLFGLYST